MGCPKPKPQPPVGQRLSVRNICCDAEVRLIKRIVEPMNGVDRVSVNPFSKICAVEPWISDWEDDRVPDRRGQGLEEIIQEYPRLRIKSTLKVKIFQEHFDSETKCTWQRAPQLSCVDWLYSVASLSYKWANAQVPPPPFLRLRNRRSLRKCKSHNLKQYLDI